MVQSTGVAAVAQTVALLPQLSRLLRTLLAFSLSYTANCSMRKQKKASDAMCTISALDQGNSKSADTVFLAPPFHSSLIVAWFMPLAGSVHCTNMKIEQSCAIQIQASWMLDSSHNPETRSPLNLGSRAEAKLKFPQMELSMI